MLLCLGHQDTNAANRGGKTTEGCAAGFLWPRWRPAKTWDNTARHQEASAQCTQDPAPRGSHAQHPLCQAQLTFPSSGQEKMETPSECSDISILRAKWPLITQIKKMIIFVGAWELQFLLCITVYSHFGWRGGHPQFATCFLHAYCSSSSPAYKASTPPHQFNLFLKTCPVLDSWNEHNYLPLFYIKNYNGFQAHPKIAINLLQIPLNIKNISITFC